MTHLDNQILARLAALQLAVAADRAKRACGLANGEVTAIELNRAAREAGLAKPSPPATPRANYPRRLDSRTLRLVA